MPDFITQVLTNLKEMSTRKKIAVFGALAGAIASILAVFLWLQRPKMDLLYSNLAVEDMQAIVEKLKRDNIRFEISKDKAALFVPEEEVREARLKLATEGLPGQSGVGYEIFDQSTIGVTEFVQTLNYRRALEGELGRTITQLAPILKARVHIVMPPKTLFSEAQEKARASVVVSLRTGKRLSDNQIQAIKHLVSSSVEGLNPRLVTIVDSHGRMLSRPEEDNVKMAASTSHMEYEDEFEKNMEQKVQTMLEQVVGHGKATVRIASLLNFSEIEHMEEKFDPEVQIPRSEQTGEERTINSSDSTEAAPGVASNLPKGVQPEPAKVAAKNETVKQNGVTNYEINKTTTRTIEALGTVQRLSVSVVVDGTYRVAPDASGNNVRTFVARPADEMLKLETIVKNAIGFSEDRGDSVSVINAPFETEELEEAPGFRISDWMPLIRYVIGFGIVIFLFVFVVRPIVKALVYVPPPPAPEELLAMGARPALDEPEPPEPSEPEIEPELATGATRGTESEQALESPIPSEPLIPLPQRVMELAREKPERAANLIKQILNEAPDGL